MSRFGALKPNSEMRGAGSATLAFDDAGSQVGHGSGPISLGSMLTAPHPTPYR